MFNFAERVGCYSEDVYKLLVTTPRSAQRNINSAMQFFASRSLCFPQADTIILAGKAR